MPIQERLFYLSLAVFEGGFFLYFTTDRHVTGVIFIVIGFVGCWMPIFNRPKVTIPPKWTLPFLVIMTALTYNLYDRHREVPLAWWIYALLCGIPIAVILITALAPQSKGDGAQQRLLIHSAVYGTGPANDMDVTEFLQNHQRDALVVPVSNEFFGRDPAQNFLKRLQVEYSYGNQHRQRVENWEGSRLVLPESFRVVVNDRS
jgi:hypothetical protein